jgi:hypothetical protein
MTTRSNIRLIGFGPASILTRGSDLGNIPEADVGTYPPLA